MVFKNQGQGVFFINFGRVKEKQVTSNLIGFLLCHRPHVLSLGRKIKILGKRNSC